MIVANIFRTNAKQIELYGEAAHVGMRFSDRVSEEQVRHYCENLAQFDGIINPRIEIVTTR